MIHISMLEMFGGIGDKYYSIQFLYNLPQQFNLLLIRRHSSFFSFLFFKEVLSISK